MLQKAIKTKKQVGRSMLEMLGVLAIIGVLSALAVWGLRYAYNKHKANQILEDVGLGLQTLADRKDEEGEFELNFTKASGYEVRGVMLMRSDGRADFAKVVAVKKEVCDILNKMQGDKLAIYQSYEEGAGLVKLTGCTEENTMYMAFINYGQRVGGCYPDCGIHSHCINFYECDCDEGYQLNTSGECEAVGCGATRPAMPQGADTPACCDKWGWTWNDQDGCVCPQNTFWDTNSAECQPNCETNPTSLNNIRQVCCEQLKYVWENYECSCPENTAWSDDDKKCVSNCGETQPGDPATITTQVCCEYWKNTEDQNIWVWDTENATCGCSDGQFWNVEQQKCEEYGPFCSVRFTPGHTSGQKSDCQYNFAIVNGIGTISSRGAQSECPTGYFCALDWSNDTCSSGISDSNSIIYGVCSPKDDYYIMCNSTYDPAIVTINKGCPANQFCYLTWKNEQCNKISGDSDTILYGICMDYDANDEAICPAS